MSVDERIVELLSEWGSRRAKGEEASVEGLCRDAPELSATLRGALAQSPEVREGGPTATHDGATVELDRGETTDDGFIEVTGPDTAAAERELGKLGPYRVVRLLGSGGMGVVFQAIDERLGRQVALKVLRPTLAHEPRAQERFLREARAAAALEHDHIVTIFQVGEDHGIPFLAMPLLSGMSLDARLRQDEPLPMADVLRIGREIAEGLAAAHARKVIHRDIKPANIWLEGERLRVKILDFGLARAVDEAHRLTQEDTIVGTPAYMAPEQATGAQPLDARLDLFSLGSVLYRMATGKVPFKAKGAVETLVALVQTDPTPPRELNPEVSQLLNDLILELLAKDPAQRPPSARAVVERIEAIEARSGLDIPLIRLDHHEPAQAVRRPYDLRHKSWIVGGSIALCVFALAALVLPRVVGLFDDKGRLTIDTPLPYVLVVVRQSGQQVAVIDLQRQSTIALWPGAYDLALEGEHVGLNLATDRIVLKRGDRQVVKVVSNPAATAPEPAVVVPGAVAAAGAEEPPGLILRPAPVPGLGRWQVETRMPRTVVRGLAFSRDRRRLACVADHERVVRIYDAAEYELVGLLVGHTAAISSVAWSPTGRQLATTSQDGTVRLWSPDGSPGPVLKEHGGTPLCLAWSPGGQWLAVGGTERSVRIWGRDGTPGPVLEEHGGSISALAWSPEGQRLIVGTAEGLVQLSNLEGTIGPILAHETHTVLSVSWSSDGRLVAAGGHDGARIWTAEGDPGPVLEDEPAGVASLSWSPTAATLAAACSDGTLRLWNAEGQPGAIMAGEPTPGKAVGATALSGSGSTGMIALAWSADGTHLASAGQDGAVRQWSADGTPGPAMAVPLNPFRSVAWSPDGTRFVSDFPLAHAARIWDAAQGRGPILKGNQATVSAVAWSPDGRWIAAADSADAVRLWSEDGTPGRVIVGEAGAITSIAWSPDSRRLAAGCFNNTVHLIDVDDKDGHAAVQVLSGHTAHVLCVAWSPDGRRIASGGSDFTIRLWDVAEKTSTVLGKHGQRVEALAWSPDGRQLASAGHDALAQVWTTDGAAPLVLKGHTGPILAVAWSRDGKRLCTAGADGTIRLWSDDGTPGPSIVIGSAATSALAWSKDGKRFASAGEDGTLRTWNLSGLRMDRVLVPISQSKVVVLDRSGQVIHATSGADRDLVAYQVSPRGEVSLMSFSELQKKLDAKPKSRRSD
jgi:WD40 repeat protein/serine/threonine protein kinase